jgi:hypothetical protein
MQHCRAAVVRSGAGIGGPSRGEAREPAAAGVGHLVCSHVDQTTAVWGRPVSTRRISSRRVVLSATFLALAAGGTAACDASSPEGTTDTSGIIATEEPAPAITARITSAPITTAPITSAPTAGARSTKPSATPKARPIKATTPAAVPTTTEPSTEEVFYCADEAGEIVDDGYCAEDDEDGYFLWHSPDYAPDLTPGTIIDGGGYFPAGDLESRRAFQVPAGGPVRNGSVKTNIVGRTSGTSTSIGGSSGG